MAAGYLYMLPFLTICYLPIAILLALTLPIALRYGLRLRMVAATLIALPLAPIFTTALVVVWGRAFGSQLQVGCLQGGICCNGASFNSGIDGRVVRRVALCQPEPALKLAELRA